MSVRKEPIKVAVIGVGRMGRHHARIYADLPQAHLVAVVDPDEDRVATVADELGCDECTSVDQLLAKHPNIQAVSVAAPTPIHGRVARPVLHQGIACLIEKPLAATMTEAKAIAGWAAEHGAILQPGHTERFNPAVRAIDALDMTPRFVEVDRVGPLSFRSLDVGVVMDMMIHDLDIVLMLTDSPLRRVDAAGIAVLGEHEDVANARLMFENGCVANLTSSRLALKTERKMRVFSEDAYVSLDYQRCRGVVIRKEHNAEALEQVRRQLASGVDLSDLDYSALVHVEELTMDSSEGQPDPLTAQLISFLDAVRTHRRPEVDAAAGFAAVDAAEKVIESLREHRWEGLAEPRV